MIIRYITSLYQLLQFTWNKQDLGTISCSEMMEETAELGAYEKKLMNWENYRRNGWTGSMREEPAELGEWQKKLLNWENDRRNDWTGRMREVTAELGEWQKKWLNWENDRKTWWTGRLTEETGELGEWQKKKTELREWKRKWLHTNLRHDREGCSIKKKNQDIPVIHKTDVTFELTCISQDFAKCQQKLPEPKTSAVSATSIICKFPVMVTWTPNRLSQRLKRGSHT